MKASHLAPIALAGLAITASCSQGSLDSETKNGTGGTSMGAQSGNAPTTGGTGGATGTGGTPSSVGGAGAVAGTSAMTVGGAGGGAPQAGTGSGATGGMSGSTAIAGSSTGASAGTGPVTGGAGGAPASGGAPPMGGQGPAGGAGSGVTAGTTSTGGMSGGGPLDPTVIVPDFDGFYWEGTCSGNVTTSGKNCPVYDNGATSCPSGATYDTTGTSRNKSIKVHGTAGTQYTITFEVRGIAGTRCYTGGTPASNSTPSTTAANNTWYAGGTPSGTSWWNSYELHVENPPVTGAPNAYYFNGFPSPDWCEKEATYRIGYTASFKVMGDSTLRFTLHDSNCQSQQNCGPDDQAATCNTPQTVDLTGMTGSTSFTQPPTNTIGSATYHPQWLYFDVKSITSP